MNVSPPNGRLADVLKADLPAKDVGHQRRVSPLRPADCDALSVGDHRQPRGYDPDGPDQSSSLRFHGKAVPGHWKRPGFLYGGGATPNDDPDDIQLNDAEFKAIFDTAKERKISVTAHVYGPRLMKKLMGFGITGIEHGSLIDEETAKMFEDTGTYLVPTFSPFQEAVYPDSVNMAKKSPESQRKLAKYQTQM